MSLSETFLHFFDQTDNLPSKYESFEELYFLFHLCKPDSNCLSVTGMLLLTFGFLRFLFEIITPLEVIRSQPSYMVASNYSSLRQFSFTLKPYPQTVSVFWH